MFSSRGTVRYEERGQGYRDVEKVGKHCTRQMTRQYAAVIRDTKPKRYKMTIRSKKAHPPEEIQQLLKAKIKPGEIKVGVTTLKSLNDSVPVETNSIEETETLGRESKQNVVKT